MGIFWKVVENPHKMFPQLIVAAVGSFGFFCTGTVRGWSSPGIPSLNLTADFDTGPTDMSWIAAVSTLYAIFGALLVSYPLQRFGRRAVLIGLCLPFSFGYFLMGLAYAVGRQKVFLLIGRSLAGLMNGAITPASQIYISECSSPRIRGFLSSFTASALAFGILVSFIIGTFVEWWVMAYLLSMFPLVLFAGMIFMPETPFWLLTHNRENEARIALQRLRGKLTNIDAEFQRIKENVEKNTNQQQEKFQLQDLFKDSVWKPLGVSMGIMFFQQFTGINAMIFFTVSIFQSAGSTIEGHYATIIIGIVQLIFTASSGFMVDRFGRRFLLLASAGIVSCSLAVMGAFFYIQREWGVAMATEKIGWLPLVSLIVFFMAYSSGYANVPFILMGELFPARYRSVLGPVSSSFNLLCTFTVVRSFPDMQLALGQHGVFWFFMCCTLVGILFIYFLLPETKGKTLEDIEKLFTTSYTIDVRPRLHTPSVTTLITNLSEETTEDASLSTVTKEPKLNNRTLYTTSC